MKNSIPTVKLCNIRFESVMFARKTSAPYTLAFALSHTAHALFVDASRQLSDEEDRTHTTFHCKNDFRRTNIGRRKDAIVSGGATGLQRSFVKPESVGDRVTR